MKIWLTALLQALTTGALAQDPPGNEEAAVDEEGDDEEMIEMGKDEGGMLLGLDFVFTKVRGDAGDAFGPGLGGDLWGGYRIGVGDVGIIPRVEFTYEKFLKKEGKGGSLITVLPGLLVDYRAGNVSPWLGFGLGLGSLWHDANGDLGRANEFTLEFSAGVNYHVTEMTAVGAFLAYDIEFTAANSTKFLMLGAGPLFNF